MNKSLERIFNKCNEVIRNMQCSGGSRKYEYEMRKKDVVARY